MIIDIYNAIYQYYIRIILSFNYPFTQQLNCLVDLCNYKCTILMMLL